MPRVQVAVISMVGIGIAITLFFPSGPAGYPILRLAAALFISAGLLLVSLRSPSAAVLAGMGFLGFLGLTRRLLIPAAGWTSYDPLLLTGPLCSVFLLIRLFAIEKRALAKDLLSKAVLLLVAISLLESLNPIGGNLTAGLAGLLFVAAPLAWFFVGRELDSFRLSTMLALVLLLGTGTALYGLWQSLVGLPAWDASWVQLNGYGALNVGGTIRAFGTFASSAEYAAYLASALMIGVAALLRHRPIALIPIPVLGIALFLESGRGVLIMAVAAVVTLMGLNSGRWSITMAAIAGAAVLATSSILLFGPQLARAAVDSGNPLVAHQVSGLTNPLDPSASTLLLHLQIVSDGLSNALRHPLGMGTAATNIAGQNSGDVVNTEVDVSNAFVSLGLVGGLLFVMIVVIAVHRVAGLAIAGREADILAVMGILIVTAGQWLNGGYYAISPLVWLLLGICTRRWLDRKRGKSDSTMRSGVVPIA